MFKHIVLQRYIGSIERTRFTWETPTRTQFSKRSEIYELELENGKTLRATPDHKVLTKNRGDVELSEDVRKLNG